MERGCLAENGEEMHGERRGGEAAIQSRRNGRREGEEGNGNGNGDVNRNGDRDGRGDVCKVSVFGLKR